VRAGGEATVPGITQNVKESKRVPEQTPQDAHAMQGTNETYERQAQADEYERTSVRCRVSSGTERRRGLCRGQFSVVWPPPRGRSLRIANRSTVRAVNTSCTHPPAQHHFVDKAYPFRPLGLQLPDVTMAVDPLSPIAPARIRALLLPVGRIKRSRFLTFVDLLQQESLVRLGDISPDPRPDRSMSPLKFCPSNVC
jgi:hypothetical protein